MAKKDDKTKPRPARSPAVAAPAAPLDDATTVSSAEELALDPEDALIEAVDKERARLMQAGEVKEPHVPYLC